VVGLRLGGGRPWRPPCPWQPCVNLSGRRCGQCDVTDPPHGQPDWFLGGSGGCRWPVLVLFSSRSSSRNPRATTPSQSDHGLGRDRRRPVSASASSSQGSPRGSPALLETRSIRPLPQPSSPPPVMVLSGPPPGRVRSSPPPGRVRPGVPPRRMPGARCSTGWRWRFPRRRRRWGSPRGVTVMTGWRRR